MNIDKITNEVNEYLKSDSEYSNMVIELILYDKDKGKYDIYVSDGRIGHLIYENNKLSDYEEFLDWDYSVDGYIFYNLENGYDIVYITDDTHYGIWCEINNYSLEDINYKDGFNKYLNYCKDNNITNEYLDEKCIKNNSAPNIFKNKYLFPESLER